MNFSILTRADHIDSVQKLRGDILRAVLGQAFIVYFVTVQFHNPDSQLRVRRRAFMRVLRLRVSTSVMDGLCKSICLYNMPGGAIMFVLHSVACAFLF